MKFENQTFNKNTDLSSYDLGIDNHKKYKFINCEFDNVDFKKLLDSLGCSGVDTKCFEKTISFTGCRFTDCRWIRRGCPVALYFISCSFEDCVVMDSGAENISINDCVFNECSIRNFRKTTGDRNWTSISVLNATFNDCVITDVDTSGNSLAVEATAFNRCKIRDILTYEFYNKNNAYVFCIMNKEYINEETDSLFKNTYISDILM